MSFLRPDFIPILYPLLSCYLLSCLLLFCCSSQAYVYGTFFFSLIGGYNDFLFLCMVNGGLGNKVNRYLLLYLVSQCLRNMLYKVGLYLLKVHVVLDGKSLSPYILFFLTFKAIGLYLCFMVPTSLTISLGYFVRFSFLWSLFL